MSVSFYVLSAILMAFINRIRGGGLDMVKAMLPGKPAIWASLMAGILYGSFAGAFEGAIFGAGFWVWSLLGWGHWFDLHRNDAFEDPDRPRGLHGFIVDGLSFGSDHLALFIRHLWCAPCLVGLAFLSGNLWMMALIPVFALATVLIFEIMWQKYPDTSCAPGMQTHAIGYAEVAVGALWWVVIAPAAFM